MFGLKYFRNHNEMVLQVHFVQNFKNVAATIYLIMSEAVKNNQ